MLINDLLFWFMAVELFSPLKKVDQVLYLVALGCLVIIELYEVILKNS